VRWPIWPNTANACGKERACGVARLPLDQDDTQTDVHGDPCSWTALAFAAADGHEAVVRFLLEQANASADRAVAFAAKKRA
jgi:hypothetical protein